MGDDSSLLVASSRWLYLVAAALVAAGFADFSLIAFNSARTGVIDVAIVPVFYACAMAAGGLAALVFGRLYDRVGISTLSGHGVELPTHPRQAQLA